MTYLDIIRNHLEKHSTITSKTAFEKYGITRLSAVIYNLRDEGLNIITEYATGKNRYGGRTTYAVYRLVKKNGGK